MLWKIETLTEKYVKSDYLPESISSWRVFTFLTFQVLDIVT